MFIGREKELANLNELYAKEAFQLFVLYGRRRMGKTTFIREFCKDKRSLIITALEANDYMNLERFSKEIYDFFGYPSGLGSFKNWNALFDFLAQRAEEERFILAFDEFPYAAKERPEIKSILQNCIVIA